MEKKALENEEDRKQKKTEKTPSHARWVIRVSLIAVALSAAMSLCSGAVLEDAGYVTATLILLLFIALGILFDIIGVAVTAANPKPFNSMAAHRVKGAKEALYLIRNAEKVASFCNDVVGDICGIVSGSTAPRFEARCPPVFDTFFSKNSRRSVHKSCVCESFRVLMSRGSWMVSRINTVSFFI